MGCSEAKEVGQSQDPQDGTLAGLQALSSGIRKSLQDLSGSRQLTAQFHHAPAGLSLHPTPRTLSVWLPSPGRWTTAPRLLLPGRLSLPCSPSFLHPGLPVSRLLTLAPPLGRIWTTRELPHLPPRGAALPQQGWCPFSSQDASKALPVPPPVNLPRGLGPGPRSPWTLLPLCATGPRPGPLEGISVEGGGTAGAQSSHTQPAPRSRHFCAASKRLTATGTRRGRRLRQHTQLQTLRQGQVHPSWRPVRSSTEEGAEGQATGQRQSGTRSPREQGFSGPRARPPPRSAVSHPFWM